MCCFSQLSLLTEQLAHLIRIDPFTVFPREVSLKVLQYLDAISLCRAAQVSKTWKSLADDDILWRGICEQHIGQKCLKCGWGLPILERRRALRISPSSPSPSPSIYHPSSQHVKRELDHDVSGSEQPAKRLRLSAAPSDSSDSSLPIQSPVPSSSSHPAINSAHLLDSSRTSTPNPLVPSASGPQAPALTRPWKDVYCERLTIERNWRRGRCTVRTLKGHADGVMCLQFSETLSHPAFPILITGSYDRTARVWNLETGRELHCLTGHTRAVRALQFDEVKLITGSMDHTMKVWDWRTGKCLRTLEGHTEGVVCLNFDSNVLASGSVDTTVKVWNFRTGECFTLRGHREWVNAVHLWDAGTVTAASFRSSPGSLSPRPSSPSTVNGQATIDPGKMLFSASDDGTIRLWDLSDRCCVRQFTGHVGQVQSLKLLTVDKGCDDDEEDEEVPTIPSPSLTPPTIRDQDLRDAGRSSRSGNNLLPSHTDAFTSGSGSNPFAYITPTPSSSTLSTTIAALTGSSSLPRMASSSTVNPEGLHVPSAGGQTYTNASVYLDGNPGTLNSKGKGRELGQHGSMEPTERPSSSASSSSHRGNGGGGSGVGAGAGAGKKNKSKPVLISGSLDNMIKLWDIDSGKVTKTFFGHIEGVWAVACDNLRLVSGSHDRTIKVSEFGATPILLDGACIWKVSTGRMLTWSFLYLCFRFGIATRGSVRQPWLVIGVLSPVWR